MYIYRYLGTKVWLLDPWRSQLWTPRSHRKVASAGEIKRRISPNSLRQTLTMYTYPPIHTSRCNPEFWCPCVREFSRVWVLPRLHWMEDIAPPWPPNMVSYITQLSLLSYLQGWMDSYDSYRCHTPLLTPPFTPPLSTSAPFCSFILTNR